ncbi:Uncharacterised protein [Mycobacteroides abscessus subsp. abscessus]|nr:Uncharacterised protein [Mycobacteroides abscessus subsp. abscessus]
MHLIDGDVAVQLGGQGRHSGIGDATRHDGQVGIETVIAVQRESVHGDAALHAYADRGDLAFRLAAARGQPHTRAALDTLGLHAQLRADRDDRFLNAANVVHHVDGLGELHYRVADQLAGSVPRDLAATVGVDDGRAVDGPLLRFGAPPRGVDGGVLQGQQGVGSAGDPCFDDVTLQLPCHLVVDHAQIPYLDGGCAGPDGSMGAVHGFHYLTSSVDCCWRRPAPRRWCGARTRIRAVPTRQG